MTPPRKSLADRFWPKVQISDPQSCWEWTGGKVRDGYGSVGIQNSELSSGPIQTFTSAHRLSWYLYNGSLPNGLMVCHHCDNPGCVNPAHLFVSDRSGNMRDAYEKGRLAASLEKAWAARWAVAQEGQ